jgi:hypothetical protein
MHAPGAKTQVRALGALTREDKLLRASKQEEKPPAQPDRG